MCENMTKDMFHLGIGKPNVNKMDSCHTISLMEIKNIMKVRDMCDDHDDVIPHQ